MELSEIKAVADFENEIIKIRTCLPDYKVSKKLFGDSIVISKHSLSAYLRYDQSKGWIQHKPSRKKKIGLLVIGLILVLLFNLLGFLIYKLYRKAFDDDDKELNNFNYTLKTKLLNHGIYLKTIPLKS